MALDRKKVPHSCLQKTKEYIQQHKVQMHCYKSKQQFLNNQGNILYGVGLKHEKERAQMPLVVKVNETTLFYQKQLQCFQWATVYTVCFSSCQQRGCTQLTSRSQACCSVQMIGMLQPYTSMVFVNSPRRGDVVCLLCTIVCCLSSRQVFNQNMAVTEGLLSRNQFFIIMSI